MQDTVLDPALRHGVDDGGLLERPVHGALHAADRLVAKAGAVVHRGHAHPGDARLEGLQGEVDRDLDSGARGALLLQGVAVGVDEPRGDGQAGGVEVDLDAARSCGDLHDVVVTHDDARVLDDAVGEDGAGVADDVVGGLVTGDDGVHWCASVRDEWPARNTSSGCASWAMSPSTMTSTRLESRRMISMSW